MSRLPGRPAQDCLQAFCRVRAWQLEISTDTCSLLVQQCTPWSVSVPWADSATFWAQVGKYGPGQPADFTGPRVTRSVEESLQRLDTHYIDLILVHDVEYVDDLKEVVFQSHVMLGCIMQCSADSA